MSRLTRLALVAAVFAAAASAPALAFDPPSRDYIGFELTPAPSISVPGDAASATPGWEPLDATYAGGYAFLEGALDPIALIEPGPGPTPASRTSSMAAAAATAAPVTSARAPSSHAGCDCPCG